MINIFSGDLIEVTNVKNLLENAGITVFLLNEHMSNIEPWLVTSGGFNSATLKINDDEFEKAKQIIDEYKNGAPQ
jgi:hypothetical protein